MATVEESKIWHLLDAEEAARELGTSLETGLSDQEASSRLRQYGPNKMREEKRISPFMLFINQFRKILN